MSLAVVTLPTSLLSLAFLIAVSVQDTLTATGQLFALVLFGAPVVLAALAHVIARRSA